MTRFLILFLWGWLAYLLLRMLFQLFRGHGSREGTKEDMHTLVYDPNCNTFIARSGAIKRRIRGKPYYFCSKACYREHQKRLNS
jgi:YHS domain-containing protein